MQVLCRKSSGFAELYCCVCGQGFVLFWDRQTQAERAATRHMIQETLLRHHRTFRSPDAHPQGGFLVPAADMSPTAPSIPGNAPTWEL